MFRDQATAERVIGQLKSRLAGGKARQGTREDRLESLNAEMSEEIEHSFVSPQAGVVYTKEAMKTGAWMMPVCLLAGIVVTLPIVFVIPGELSSGNRLLAGIVIGLLGGGTVGLVLMALGQKRPNERMAAERGVVVRVAEDREEVRQVLLDAHPLRLDVVDDQGRPIETVYSEPDDTLEPETFDERQKKRP